MAEDPAMGGRCTSTALLAALSLLGAASLAHAGAATTSTSSAGCGCVPNTHQVKVPGIDVSPPTVTVELPSLNVVGGNASSSSSDTASASANVGVSISTSGSSVSNAQAIANANSGSYGGGGGAWSDSGSVTSTLETVKVETPMETRRICAVFKAAVRAVALQASCLDDKSIPHPASQLGPERDIPDHFEGEVYRCIAGARMQYTLADYTGQANFDHGQTLTCQKGEALYHSASGLLQCRAQKPARDCNERSLLRRFGAGIKILKVSQSDICAEWRTETVQASAAP